MIKRVSVITIVALAIALISSSMYVMKEDFVYVDMSKIYNEFELSKEINKEIELLDKRNLKTLDSIYDIIKTSALDNDKSKEVMEMQNRFFDYKSNLEKSKEKFVIESNNKIWNQINHHLKEFGKSKKYSIIFGANGQGNIMYADEKKDVTEDALLYINNEYSGK